MLFSDSENVGTSICKCPPRIAITAVNLNLPKLACPVSICELQISARAMRCNRHIHRLCASRFQYFSLQMCCTKRVITYEKTTSSVSSLHHPYTNGSGPSSPCFRWRLHRFLAVSGFQETIFDTVFRFIFGVQIRHGILRSRFYHPYLRATA